MDDMVLREAPKVGASLEGLKVNQSIEWPSKVNKALRSLKLDRRILPRALNHNRARPKIRRYKKIRSPMSNWITR